MAPLIFLLATFVILYLLNRIVLNDRLTLSFIGRASMAVMLTVTGVVHFTSTDWMVGMMPDFIPAKRELVWFTGICELAAVVGLLWDRLSRLTSILLIIFFLCPDPARKHLRKPQAGHDRPGIRQMVSTVPHTAADIFYLVGLVFWVKSEPGAVATGILTPAG
jgi:uncharacterized membrane protein